jgi:hypothetical protein
LGKKEAAGSESKDEAYREDSIHHDSPQVYDPVAGRATAAIPAGLAAAVAPSRWLGYSNSFRRSGR